MLSKVYPELQYDTGKYEIDHFHNPYLPKLNIKFTSRETPKSFKFISPLSLNNNIYVSQAIPIYKNQKFRFALLWRQSISNRYAKAHFGFSTEYKLYESLKIKNKMLFGTTSLIDFQVAKYLKNNLEIMCGYSGFLENSNLYSSFNLGMRKGIFSAFLSKKINSHNQIRLNLSKQISNGLYLNNSYQCNLEHIRQGQLQLNLSQKLSAKNTVSLGVVANPYFKEMGLKVQFQHMLAKHQKLLLAVQCTQSNSYLYLGFKNLNFNFIFPVMAVDGPLPIIIGIVGFGMAYLYKKFYNKNKKLVQQKIKQKQVEDRILQLRLINDKASDLYEKQKLNHNGLLIQQAFIGPKDQIEQFMNNPNHIILFNQNQQFKNKYIDLTVTLRFYVSKGQLKIRKGQKDKLLGFHRTNVNQNTIGINYIRNNKRYIIFFDYLEPIVIVKQ